MDEQTASDFLSRYENALQTVALRVADSGGRPHPENEHPYRTCYQRDRDRIIHCSAFRRLDSKTQVFVPHKQDHYRTRLTHTLEVAQIARTLARALAVNEDVAEAVALAHDLGHPPFGHTGEDALNELMADEGGFEHNCQSLRVVDYLEHPYSDFRGINLTNVVRRCLAKHESRYDTPAAEEFDDGLAAPLEGQLVDLADEIAYTYADMYDALAAGWIDTNALGELELWRRAAERAGQDMPNARPIHQRIHSCRNLLAILADDALRETRRRIQEMQIRFPADVQAAPQRCAAFSNETASLLGPLHDFLHQRVYEHPTSARHSDQARQIISKMFGLYLANPSLLPPRYRGRIVPEGIHRVICDYIAGMTDPYARQEHQRISK